MATCDQCGYEVPGNAAACPDCGAGSSEELAALLIALRTATEA